MAAEARERGRPAPEMGRGSEEIEMYFVGKKSVGLVDRLEVGLGKEENRRWRMTSRFLTGPAGGLVRLFMRENWREGAPAPSWIPCARLVVLRSEAAGAQTPLSVTS